METDGSLSILKRSDDAAPTKADYNMPNQTPCLPITLISDGRLLKENLKRSGMNEALLQQELDKKGIWKYSEVLLAEWKKRRPHYMFKNTKALPPLLLCFGGCIKQVENTRIIVKSGAWN